MSCVFFGEIWFLITYFALSGVKKKKTKKKQHNFCKFNQISTLKSHKRITLGEKHFVSALDTVGNVGILIYTSNKTWTTPPRDLSA